MAPQGGVIRGDDRRRLVPQALCAVIRVLLSEVEGPSYEIVELKRMLRCLELMYKIPPAVTDSDIEQMLAEEDGIPQEDAV